MSQPMSNPAVPRLRASLAGLALALSGLTVGVAACGDDPPSMTMPSREDHARRYFPVTSSSAHGEFACNDCHGETGGFELFDCLGCHTGAHANEVDVTALHAGVAADFRWESAACYGCHRDGTGIVDHATRFPIASGPHANATCTECHTQQGDRSVLGCAGCHGHERAQMDAVHREKTGYTFESRACLRCHPAGRAEGD